MGLTTQVADQPSAVYPQPATTPRPLDWIQRTILVAMAVGLILLIVGTLSGVAAVSDVAEAVRDVAEAVRRLVTSAAV